MADSAVHTLFQNILQAQLGATPPFDNSWQPQVGELVGQPQGGPVQATLPYCGQPPRPRAATHWAWRQTRGATQ